MFVRRIRDAEIESWNRNIKTRPRALEETETPVLNDVIVSGSLMKPNINTHLCTSLGTR